MTEALYADCPLSLFDGTYQGVGIVLGWLIEGLLDLKKVDNALSGLVTKWPLLSGRLQRTGVCPFIPFSGTPTYLNESTEETRSQNQSASRPTPGHICPVFTHFKEFYKTNHRLYSTPSPYGV